MKNNAWLKLAVVSILSIVIIYTVIWGFNQFANYNSYGRMGYGYGYGMNNFRQGEGRGMMGQSRFGMNGYAQGGMGFRGGMGRR